MTETVAEQIGVATRAIIEQSKRLGLTWALRPGTVSLEDPSLPQVIMDGDIAQIPALSLIGPIPLNARVMLLVTPPSGVYVIGYLGISDPRPLGQVAFVERSTSSTASATAQGVLRLDGVQLYKNRRYEFAGHGIMLPTVAGIEGSLRFAYTIDGTVATTASTLLSLTNADLPSTANGATLQTRHIYTPTTDVELSLIMFTIRIAGASGNVSLFCSGDLRTQLYVNDLGLATRRGTGTVI